MKPSTYRIRYICTGCGRNIEASMKPHRCCFYCGIGADRLIEKIMRLEGPFWRRRWVESPYKVR